jgi:hypothetical protein
MMVNVPDAHNILWFHVFVNTVPPEDSGIIGLTHNFEPSRATFDPTITVSFSYDPDDLPEGVREGFI